MHGEAAQKHFGFPPTFITVYSWRELYASTIHLALQCGKGDCCVLWRLQAGMRLVSVSQVAVFLSSRIQTDTEIIALTGNPDSLPANWKQYPMLRIGCLGKTASLKIGKMLGVAATHSI